MLLQTSIKPRRDGTVKVQGSAKNRDGTHVSFEFKPDENGDLVCDVTEDALAASLLAGGYFHPVNEEDFEAAMQLANAAGGEGGPDGAEDPEDDGGDDDGDDPVDPNAPPVEGSGAQPPVDGAGQPVSSRRRRV